MNINKSKFRLEYDSLLSVRSWTYHNSCKQRYSNSKCQICSICRRKYECCIEIRNIIL